LKGFYIYLKIPYKQVIPNSIEYLDMIEHTVR